MDDEVELLLLVTLECKVDKCQDSIARESCKYNNIFEVFNEQYSDVTVHINNYCHVQVEVIFNIPRNLRFSCPHEYRKN